MNEKNDQMNNQQVFEEKIQLQLKIVRLYFGLTLLKHKKNEIFFL